MDLGYAAAKLRLGFIQGRRGQNEPALKSFTEAENLYNAASDLVHGSPSTTEWQSQARTFVTDYCA